MSAAKEESELSEEEWRKLLKPNPSNAEVIELIKTHFAASPSHAVVLKKELDSYDDRNFWISIDNTDYLVKFHNGVESKNASNAMANDRQDSVIHYQYAIMKALGEHGIPASRPVFPRNSPDKMLAVKVPVWSKDHSPYELIVSVYSWVEGNTMQALKVLPIECLADAGSFLGKIHQAFDKALPMEKLPQAATRHHQWDGKNTKELSQFVHHIQDPDRRAMIRNIIETFDKDLIQSGVAARFRTSVNHGDYNDANILINDMFQVTGVIDFGDSTASWTVLDVSVAMAYAMLSTYAKPGRSISAAAAILRGFHSVYPLTDTERAHLILLIACRLACSTTLGAFSYQKNPENKYLLIHSQPAWDTLEFIWGSNDPVKRMEVGKAMKALFDKACDTCQSISDGVIDCGDITIGNQYVLELQSTLLEQPPAKRQKGSGDSKVITFVTGNKKKLEEVQRILVDDSKEACFTLTNAKIDLPELQGDPVSIAKDKCEAAAKAIGGAVITEDTSLCFMALQELPGPYIKWFLEKCGHEGLNNMISAYDNKSAYAQTVVAYCEGPGKEVHAFEGRTMGKVVPARGKLDFGWDPIFEPDEGGGKTYAEMNKDEKDSMSHRSRAFSKLKTFLLG